MKLADQIATAVRNSDPLQLHRLGNIARFFAALLVVTLVARGTAGATMPIVTVKTPGSGTVSKSVSTNGTISYAGGQPFTLPEGLLVLQVPVQVGQSVKAGDTLAVFDAGEVSRAVDSKRAELQQMELQAKQQAEGNTADPYSAQLAQEQLERAYEQTHKTYAAGEESVARVQQKRDEAARAVEDARNAPLDPELPQKEAEAQKKANVETATAALEAAEEELYQAKKAAEAANESALSAAQSAEDNRNSALHALEEEEETVAEQNQTDRAAAAVSQAKAATLQAELDALLALQQAGACYLAPKDGTLVTLNLKAGEPSSAVGGLLADQDVQYTLEVPLNEEQAALVSVGTILHAVQNKASGDAAVQSLSAPDAEGSVTATATLPDGAWSAGAVTVTASVQGARQNLVLPSTAVRQDNQGQYVLAVEEKSTILGLQNVLVRLTVTVLETGDSTVAVSGALDSQTQIVVSSNKSVQAGDTVRLQDDS